MNVPAARPPQNRAELAARHGVAISSVHRALAKAEAAHRADPAVPAPPAPLNPGSAVPVYDPDAFDAWWPTRRGRGRRPR